MKVIILKDNTVKDVNEGYARNYLLPKGLAKIATPDELTKRADKLKQDEIHRKEQDKQDEKLSAEFQDRAFIIKVEKIGDHNKLFGSVTAKDIAQQIGVPKENILLKEPIKTAGEHVLELKFGQHHSKIRLTIQKGA